MYQLIEGLKPPPTQNCRNAQTKNRSKVNNIGYVDEEGKTYRYVTRQIMEWNLVRSRDVWMNFQRGRTRNENKSP